jgi:preprotein translocase subunit SecG
MYTFLLILLVLDAILLGVVVLLQAGQGGGLASLGGGTTDMVVGGRQAVTLLTTATWWTGGIFLFLSLVLSVVQANRSVGTSEVQERLRQQSVAAGWAGHPDAGQSAGSAADRSCHPGTRQSITRRQGEAK